MLKSVATFIRHEKKYLAVFLLYTAVVFLVARAITIEKIVAYVQEFGPLAPLLFIAGYLVRGFFYFPTLYFLIAASLIFPLPHAVIYYFTGILLSATLSYNIGKLLNHKNVFPRIKKKVADESRTKKYDYSLVFFFHVTGLSLDIPNYVSGYIKLNYLRFMLIVIAANAITTTLYFCFFEYFVPKS